MEWQLSVTQLHVGNKSEPSPYLAAWQGGNTDSPAIHQGERPAGVGFPLCHPRTLLPSPPERQYSVGRC